MKNLCSRLLAITALVACTLFSALGSPPPGKDAVTFDGTAATTPPALGPFSLAGVYDVQAHQTCAVVTYAVRSYGTEGKVSLDLIGFGGSTVGPNASVTGGGALVASYPLSFNALRFRVGFGPAMILTANDKPHIGFFGGISGTF